MQIQYRIAGWLSRPQLLRPTVRLRLTFIYGTLSLLTGVGLLALTYILVAHSTGSIWFTTRLDGSDRAVRLPEESVSTPQILFGEDNRPDFLEAQNRQTDGLASQQHDALMREMLVQSGVALAVMTAFSAGLGWVVAGRALRPMRTIASTVQKISATNLHDRLTINGPNDEIAELCQTFNGLLSRLERSFDAQRQFVANASHELRTPLARQRTLIEVALSDPDATVESLKANYSRVLAASEQQERLIEALLTLARSERGLDRLECLDLAVIIDTALSTFRPEVERRQLHMESTLLPAQISGDSRLIERLVMNLLDNAIRYNVDGGEVQVMTEAKDSHVVFSISNTGLIVNPENVDQLFRPFQRGGTSRLDHGGGLGLGLSIVQAIVIAHDAVLDAQARPQGGLMIKISISMPTDGESVR